MGRRGVNRHRRHGIQPSFLVTIFHHGIPGLSQIMSKRTSQLEIAIQAIAPMILIQDPVLQNLQTTVHSFKPLFHGRRETICPADCLARQAGCGGRQLATGGQTDFGWDQAYPWTFPETRGIPQIGTAYAAKEERKGTAG